MACNANGRKAMLMIWKQRKGIERREHNANEFVFLRMARYLEATRAAFRGLRTQVWSVSWDATRAGGKDLLFSCLWNAEAGVGAWLNPQVRA